MSGPDFILIIHGAFGVAVAESIAQRNGATRVVPLESAAAALDDFFSEAHFVGLVCSRRFPELQHALDAAGARARVPWSTALLDGRRLQSGPVVSPGHGPCFGCWEKRRLSHLVLPEREQALDAAYREHADLTLRGFLPSHVTMAAAGLLLDQREHQRVAGRVRFVDLLDGEVEETRAVRIHGCDRCGDQCEPGERYVRHLRDELAEVFP